MDLDQRGDSSFPQSDEDVTWEPQTSPEDGEASAVTPWYGDDEYERSGHTKERGRTWLQEMPRWLATLNPGRTGREYEKALGYFFDTPGVPQELTEISFDLLLAYRGALALRANSRERPQQMRRTRGSEVGFDARLGAPWMAALPAYESDAAGGAEEARRQAVNGPLAPATVNIRLTALRQFLVHCALLNLLPTLTPDRIRAALRRLSIERRRPYQVLAESEWGAFLRAALEPAETGRAALPAEAQEEPNVSASQAQGPWGLSRAARAELRERAGEPPKIPSRKEERPARRHTLAKSRAGLTGARTAERDYALLSLALATGLRSIELVSLDVGDLVREWHEGREEWWLVLPDAKTKGQRGGRTLPLAPALVETLIGYVKATGRRWERAEDRATPLFLSRYVTPNPNAASTRRDMSAYRRLSTVQVRAIVDRVEAQWLEKSQGDALGGRIAGESRLISPHALRHSTALALLEGDGTSRPPASVEHVRGWLGHFDIRTTQGYLAHLDARKNRRPFVLNANGTPASSSDQQEEAPDEQPPTGH